MPTQSAAPGALMILLQDGMVEVTGRGEWSPGHTDAHFARLATMLQLRRAAGETVRVLVDLRAARVQSEETAARMRHWTQTIYRPADRVAILVESSLVKAQLRRVATTATRELFISESAARRWLLA